jgi:hypothetical protein
MRCILGRQRIEISSSIDGTQKRLYSSLLKRKFKDSLDSIYKLLIQYKITVGQLHKFIIEKPNNVKLFNHIEEENKKIEISEKNF